MIGVDNRYVKKFMRLEKRKRERPQNKSFLGVKMGGLKAVRCTILDYH